MDFYHGHGQRLNKELFAAKEKIKEMEDEIKIIDRQLYKLVVILGKTEETSYDDKYVQLRMTPVHKQYSRLKIRALGSDLFGEWV